MLKWRRWAKHRPRWKRCTSRNFPTKRPRKATKKIVSVDSGRLERVFGDGQPTEFQSPVSARFQAIYDFCRDCVRRKIVRQIRDFVIGNVDWFANFIEMGEGVSSDDTFRQVVNIFRPAVLQEMFQAVISVLQAESEGNHLALDGKAVRGFFASKAGEFCTPFRSGIRRRGSRWAK